MAGGHRAHARLRYGGLLCAIVLGVVAPSSLAAPGNDATIVSTTFEVPDGNAGATLATCPAGSRVVGGGVGQISPVVDTEKGQTEVEVSGPVDETGATANTNTGDVAKSWYAGIFNGNGNVNNGETESYKVFAICSQTSDATVQAIPFDVAGRDTSDNDPSGAGTANPACPAGQRATGGGVGTIDASATAHGIQLSGPFDETGTTAGTDTGDVARSWFSGVSNATFNATATTQHYKAFAICSRSSDATIESAVFQTNDVSKDANPPCPAGKRALGGGLGSTDAITTAFTHVLIVSGPRDEGGSTASTQTGDVARSWYAAAIAGSISPFTYKVYAICTPDPSAPPGGGAAGGGGATGAGAVVDRTAPKAGLAGKKTEKLDSAVEVVVDNRSSSEDGFATASGTLNTPGAAKTFRLKGIKSRRIAAGKRATLKLKVPKKALKAGKRARRRHKKVRAKIRVSVKDAAGNGVPLKRTIGLR